MRQIPPTILTIFGATGNLASDYLVPALLHMEEEGLLPQNFRLVVVGRRRLAGRTYLDFIVKKSKAMKKLPPKIKAAFLRKLTYFRGDFSDSKSFSPLASILKPRKQPRHLCKNRLYYFATGPQFFSQIAKILKNSGLLQNCRVHQRQMRVLVEKPFGFNYQSARALNRLLLTYFSEDEIYRIDHYQGKETVQNLMVMRFANALWEPLWNRDHIDHIEVSILEQDGVGSRTAYYDQTGALKDIIQNHGLLMLALILMDEPRELTTEDIRNEKVKILRALRPLTGATAADHLVRGQYRGYEREIGRKSATETYVAVKAFVDTPRWRDVPLYLRTGKALHKKVTEISIHFKEPKRCLFRGCAGNILTFRIQPDEAVFLRTNNKVPGFGVRLHQANLLFSYQQAYRRHIPAAYERLLLDFIQGDQRLFIRSDEIEAAWKFVDSITGNWSGQRLHGYKPGAAGPKAAETFIRKDQKAWFTK